MVQIPELIHYCWFGGSPLGEKEVSCINSWKEHLSEFEIVRWDESNFDVNCCPYVKEAYEAKKWAFVSDYARFRILYEHGGIYFDTDVEVIRSLDDLIKRGAFMGIEKDYSNSIDSHSATFPIMVNPGLGLAAPKKHGFYKEILDAYEKAHFITPEGDMDLTTIVERTSELLIEHGLKARSGIQRVADINIYPSEYFCPLDYVTGKLSITDNTRTIHRFGATWFSPSQKVELRINRFLVNCGVDQLCAKKISSLVAVLVCFDFGRIRRKIHKSNRNGF